MTETKYIFPKQPQSMAVLALRVEVFCIKLKLGKRHVTYDDEK